MLCVPSFILLFSQFLNVIARVRGMGRTSNVSIEGMQTRFKNAPFIDDRKSSFNCQSLRLEGSQVILVFHFNFDVEHLVEDMMYNK